MRWIDRLSKSQRVIVVIAFGLALGTVGNYLAGLGSPNLFGWTGYAPLAGGFYPLGGGPRAWLRLIIWIVLIGVWAVGSIRVLRPSSKDAASE